ncbi:MAG: hypothetical protein UT33_C0012G0070 [Candidatus Peregrinibacteria bacterium GW2011_GWC2_39_14]|nr:MAG: hypothetical protein US92_C0003G0097 [Candidatus Peregrinibacteria bacterium GW2011_GWA2_38_36]KKR05265.1 MAG: hypothetical protein UT33_C0012G0070 [Candidatus Peregrinibacteria bacterium GW2011_GWC2_39_14]
MLNVEEIKTKIRRIFSSIYIFKSEEVDGLLVRIDKMSIKGLEEVLRLAESIKEKQEEFLKEMIEKDKDFLPGLKGVLKSNTKKLMEAESDKDSAEADKLIEDFFDKN